MSECKVSLLLLSIPCPLSKFVTGVKMSLCTHLIIMIIVLMNCSSRDTLTAFTHRDYFNFFKL